GPPVNSHQELSYRPGLPSEASAQTRPHLKCRPRGNGPWEGLHLPCLSLQGMMGLLSKFQGKKQKSKPRHISVNRRTIINIRKGTERLSNVQKITQLKSCRVSV
ncbi:unnamed protein product, partial [Gulo gulo]